MGVYICFIASLMPERTMAGHLFLFSFYIWQNVVWKTISDMWDNCKTVVKKEKNQSMLKVMINNIR